MPGDRRLEPGRRGPRGEACVRSPGVRGASRRAPRGTPAKASPDRRHRRDAGRDGAVPDGGVPPALPSARRRPVQRRPLGRGDREPLAGGDGDRAGHEAPRHRLDALEHAGAARGRRGLDLLRRGGRRSTGRADGRRNADGDPRRSRDRRRLRAGVRPIEARPARHQRANERGTLDDRLHLRRRPGGRRGGRQPSRADAGRRGVPDRGRRPDGDARRRQLPAGLRAASGGAADAVRRSCGSPPDRRLLLHDLARSGRMGSLPTVPRRARAIHPGREHVAGAAGPRSQVPRVVSRHARGLDRGLRRTGGPGVPGRRHGTDRDDAARRSFRRSRRVPVGPRRPRPDRGSRVAGRARRAAAPVDRFGEPRGDEAGDRGERPRRPRRGRDAGDRPRGSSRPGRDPRRRLPRSGGAGRSGLPPRARRPRRGRDRPTGRRGAAGRDPVGTMHGRPRRAGRRPRTRAGRRPGSAPTRDRVGGGERVRAGRGPPPGRPRASTLDGAPAREPAAPRSPRPAGPLPPRTGRSGARVVRTVALARRRPGGGLPRGRPAVRPHR